MLSLLCGKYWQKGEVDQPGSISIYNGKKDNVGGNDDDKDQAAVYILETVFG
jgi:hypothetical protein